MNTVLESPAWAVDPVPLGTPSAALRQLVNAAGPVACGMAVVLNLVQREQITEDDGGTPSLDARQRGQLIAFCALAAQLLGEVASDACNELVSLGG